MMIKVEFDGSQSGVGKIKDEDESGLIIMGDKESFLLDKDVKTIYLPESIGGDLAVIEDRYFCSCPHCDGICVAAITDANINGTKLSVLHCFERKDFSFVVGTINRVN